MKEETNKKKNKRNFFGDCYSVETISEKETKDFGFKLGSIVKSKDTISITGDLGAGKTVFVKGIAMALDVKEYVTSPTFTIVNEYRGKIPVYHLDVYRIFREDDMYEIGYEDYIYGDGVVIIEWADRIEGILPLEIIQVNIQKENKNIIKTEKKCVLTEEKRIISVKFVGEKYKDYCKKLRGIL
jgi:tRNA threonylcarbamoyladenosine biosynthesis protein TsaE